MKKHWILALSALFFTVGLCGAQELRIPVYPGSVLSIDAEQGSDPQCCDFTTTASLDKVLDFFEKALKAKALGADELAKRYPALAPQVASFKEQTPGTNTKLKLIPYNPVVVPGYKEPVLNLFEILQSEGLVHYTIDQEFLTEADEPYAADFRKRTGKLNMEEEARRESEENDAQLQAQLKKEASAWAAMAATHGVPLYPGSLYEETEGPTLSAYGTDTQSLLPLILGVYKTPDPYEKVRTFFTGKLSVVTYEAMMKRKGGVDRYLAGSDYTSRVYTSKKRMEIPRDFFIGKGCVDVAVEEGKGDEKGAKLTTVLFDLDPKCKGAETFKKLLWPEDE